MNLVYTLSAQARLCYNNKPKSQVLKGLFLLLVQCRFIEEVLLTLV